jgi:hypothetical protein
MTLIPRYAKKVDATQKEIVDALRAAGVFVVVIGQPVDLLCYHAGRFMPLECKPTDPHNRNRKDQERQKEFIRVTGTPVVRTPEEAIAAVTKGVL